MPRHDEAKSDYDEFSILMKEFGAEISDEELSLKNDLDSRAAAGDGSKQKRKDELMRAVDAKGIFLWRGYRDNSPLPPPNIHESLGPNFDPESMTISLETPNLNTSNNPGTILPLS